ncbi:MAG: T9SS type B sorting domain-containing protein [Aureispira sp.]|nr:T9SS type B sorting domain-containing protein [Aureispira sp.]
MQKTVVINLITHKISNVILFSFLSLCHLMAQPSNDECDNPIIIPSSSNWCSGVGAYSNIGATPSGYGPATCFGSASNDVWFQFTAIGTDITFTVNGNQAPSPGGTLQNPQVALYTATCTSSGGTINQLQCESATISNIAEMYKGGLIIGQTYLVRVQGLAGATGSFQICTNNYNAPAQPGSDCNEAAVLCDKSSFVVQSVTSAGNDPDEASGSCLGGNGINSESNSTWFKWTCEQSGTLTFILTPNNPSDDLDFVVYELPNGLNSCAGKQELRCMAAGDFDYPSPCMGPTGLSAGSTDLNESAGCGGNKDNFVKEVSMVAGKSYALLVNNFSETGNGFSMSWGGTGTFRGPTADFLATANDNGCAGEDWTFEDQSSHPFGSITSWVWNFGLGSNPNFAASQGEHSINYTSPGTKSVALTVRTEEGCVVTKIKNLTVDSCCETVNKIEYNVAKTPVICRDNPNGTISITPNTSSSLQYTYQWSTGANGSDVNSLIVGDYAVTVSNGICSEYDNIRIDGPPPWEVVETIKRPTCDGGTDGAIQLTKTAGSNGTPYLFKWQTGSFGTNQNVNNLSNGFVDLVVRDKEGCDTVIQYRVHEVELEIDSLGAVVKDPSCYQFSDGEISVTVVNGKPPYTYLWSTGGTNSSIENLPEGSYSLDTIRDANNCRNWWPFPYELTHPELLTVDLEPEKTSCYGSSDGNIIAVAAGGTKPYSYYWPDGQRDTIATGLLGGTYDIYLEDAQGCEARDTTFVDQPAPLLIDSVAIHNTTCYGYNDGRIEVFPKGGRPGYTYSLNADKPVYSPSNYFLQPSGSYRVYVKDIAGCSVSSEPLFIDQPRQLIVDAGPDRNIKLGDTIQVKAGLNFVDYYSYKWSSNDGDIECDDCRATSMLPVADEKRYYIRIEDEKGCFSVDSMLVNVAKRRQLFIPNAFSPNEDGNNEFLDVYTNRDVAQIKDYKIYDRWGVLLFHKTDIPRHWKQFGWDGMYKGKPMNTGVFVYVIEVEFLDGVVERYAGDVTLLR